MARTRPGNGIGDYHHTEEDEVSVRRFLDIDQVFSTQVFWRRDGNDAEWGMGEYV